MQFLVSWHWLEYIGKHYDWHRPSEGDIQNTVCTVQPGRRWTNINMTLSSLHKGCSDINSAYTSDTTRDGSQASKTKIAENALKALILSSKKHPNSQKLVWFFICPSPTLLVGVIWVPRMWPWNQIHAGDSLYIWVAAQLNSSPNPQNTTSIPLP